MTKPVRNQGTGPGVRAADGSSVQLYRLLKPQGEPEIIRGVLKAGATVLELGCGVGRITHPLIEMGFDVVAVDNCAEMLAFVDGAVRVRSDIETLDLDRKFDAVLLTSHLINTPDSARRHAILAACLRHLGPNGVAIIQRHDPNWLEDAKEGFLGSNLGVETFLDRVVRREHFVEMTVRYTSRTDVWTHSFTAEGLSEAAIEIALQKAELQLERWLDDRRTWFVVRAAVRD